MQKNTQGFSIIIGIGLIIIMSLVAYLILSYMHSFTQIVSGVQNSAVAYYNAYAWVEESLYHIKQRGDTLTKEYQDLFSSPWSTPSPLPLPPSRVQPVTFYTTSSAETIPRPWFGQSEFDKNWNIVSQLHPLQIEVWWASQYNLPTTGLSIDGLKIYFRAPKLGENGPFQASTPCKDGLWSDGSLGCWSPENRLPLLMWTLVADDNSLTSTINPTVTPWSYIYAHQVGPSGWNGSEWKPTTVKGEVLNTEDPAISSLISPSDPYPSFSEFYGMKCSAADKKCSLRIGVINNLYDNGVGKKVTLPYLEYKIEMTSDQVLPDQYTHIRSVGSAGEFRRQIDLFIPQQTVPQAFDFTVIQ